MKSIGKVIILFGIILMVCGILLFAFLYFITQKGELRSKETVERIVSLLPQESVGAIDEYSSSDMPSLEIDGRNIIALIEIPSTDTQLPIEDKWNKIDFGFFPGRFGGCIYDGTLIVGGYDRKGSFDVLKKLEIGNEITVTDMMGTKYSYKVSSIERKKSAKQEDLFDVSSHVTLFVRDEGTMDYIVVRCVQ